MPRSFNAAKILSSKRQGPEALTAIGEYSSLVEQAVSGRTPMDEKLMGIVRHSLGTVGMLVVYYGYSDDATWIAVTGAVMTFVPFVWSWMAKKKDA
jgi:hypothetical protein